MNKNNTQLRYQGYVNTPQLWNDDLIGGLQQLKFKSKLTNSFSKTSINEIRLGKLIEHFVFHELSENESIDILASNIQVIDNKVTIGEIDALIKHLNDFLHLEIVYKFYLYDPTIKKSELDKWIGPNRNDWLSKKIDKLNTKQFPVLSHEKSKSILKSLMLSYELFQQKVLFKAQLFVPFNMLKNKFYLVNNECVKGYYLKFNEVKRLATTLFYIPSKLDWLVEPIQNVKWLVYSEFIIALEKELKQKRSPLCWIKTPQNDLQKIFVVYW